MNTPNETRVVSNGLTHQVLTWQPTTGSPSSTFVLCHGFLDLAWSWQGVAQRLTEAGHRVVAFSWRGHGETERVGPGGYYHFPDYILDLEGLLPQFAEEPVHLVGHSMGGNVCCYFAGMRSELLKTLTVIEGIGPLDTPPEVAVDKFEAWLRTVDRIRKREPKTMANLDEALRRLRVSNPSLPEELGRFLVDKATRPVEGGGLAWRFDPMHRTTSPLLFRLDAFEQFLERITVPTLVVGADNGLRLPDEAARVERIADAQVLELTGVGHMIHQQAPDELASALLGHIERA